MMKEPWRKIMVGKVKRGENRNATEGVWDWDRCPNGGKMKAPR